jgi:hypothetical protein
VIDELGSAVEAECCLGVADVDGKEHRASESERPIGRSSQTARRC